MLKDKSLKTIEDEVAAEFEAGKKEGETMLETAARLIWYERMKHFLLLDEMKQRATNVLEIKRDTPAVLLEWRKRIR